MSVSLSTIAWRRLLLTLCALSLLLVALCCWVLLHTGDLGLVPPQAALTGPITVEPSSPAARAGLRTGDIVDLRALSPQARYRWRPWGVPIAGERFDVPVHSGKSVRVVSIVAARTSAPPLTFWLAIASFPWSILFAVLLAWRRSDSREARTLALLLIAVPALETLRFIWYTPWVGVDVVASAIGDFFDLTCTFLVAYAMLFRVARPGLRNALGYAAYAVGAAGVLQALLYDGGYWFGTPFLTAWPASLGTWLQVTPFLLSFFCAVATLSQLQGAERTRVAWITASFGPYYVLEFIVWGLAAPGTFSDPLRGVLDVASFLAPIGLWCTLLNRRILDIGFAINRAAVFTGVSVVIVGIFVLIEWALSVWFSSASHTTNLAISALLALALGLSVRMIHSRVDRVLDAVFFRKRHEDEQAIRMLAREAAYITDSDVLLARIVETLEEHADASSAQVLLDDDSGSYSGVGENDPAIVRLRATRTPLDLRDVQTAIEGEFAYPMLARGHLVGVIVLGLKRSGETYAPDESDAIAQLAHDAGAALDVLLMKKETAGDGALERLQESTDAVLSGMRELPERIADALEKRARLA